MNTSKIPHSRASRLRIPALIVAGVLLVTGIHHATASITVDGESKDSPWDAGSGPTIGNTGTGTMEITEGSEVTSSGNGYLGYGTAGVGTVTVTGRGSSWAHAGNLYVGRAGQGTLSLQSGAAVTSVESYVGLNAGATGSVSVSTGATWTASSALYVGNNGNGTLTISNGGRVTASNGAYIGRYSTSTSTVTVTGSGSVWTNTGNLIVGREGKGKLTISAAGQVSNAVGYIGSNASGSAATVTGAGSIWTNATSLSLGTGNTLTIRDSGLVKVGGGASLNAGAGTFLQLDGGYLAWAGDNVASLNALISGGKVQLLDGSGNWVTETDLSRFSITYAALGSADTSDLTGGHYSNLGGYTILSLATIPEPATHATVAGVILFTLAGIFGRCRRRAV